MKEKYKFEQQMPYRLHDMKMNNMEKQGKNLKLYFKNGFWELQEPCKKVQGNIVVKDVDYDFASVQFLSKWGYFGKYKGRKMSLKKFLRKYKKYSFEVVDELYGYHQLHYSGYIKLPHKKSLREFELSVYYEGDLVYETM